MKINILLILLFCSSCSTLKKSVASGTLIGGLVGGTGGAVFSPDEESTNKNAYLGGVIGALAGAGIAYLMHDSPKRKVKESMLLDQPMQNHKEVPLFDFSPELKNIKPEVNFKPIKKYEVPLEKLPKELEGKVKKQFILEYQSEAQTIEVGNRTIQISPFKAWEHIYEQ
ncbi:MAG: glycine zipper 2TM domain-containing protein [Bacteriovoracaceae bacterium]|jgi:hypothetical protein|nr:glycine zipper 2TM domain-containing protein [Bacteriovoracaceae bacterium]